MTREEKITLLDNLLEIEEKNDFGNFTRSDRAEFQMWVKALEQEPKTGHCKWIKYDYRTICPKYHDNDNPYWRIPENMGEVLKYCPYCGKKIEVEND